jgi:hypothetical protein
MKWRCGRSTEISSIRSRAHRERTTGQSEEPAGRAPYRPALAAPAPASPIARPVVPPIAAPATDRPTSTTGLSQPSREPGGGRGHAHHDMHQSPAAAPWARPGALSVTRHQSPERSRASARADRGCSCNRGEFKPDASGSRSMVPGQVPQLIVGPDAGLECGADERQQNRQDARVDHDGGDHGRRRAARKRPAQFYAGRVSRCTGDQAADGGTMGLGDNRPAADRHLDAAGGALATPGSGRALILGLVAPIRLS